MFARFRVPQREPSDPNIAIDVVNGSGETGDTPPISP